MIPFKGMHDTVTVWVPDGKQKLRKHYLGMQLIILSIVSNCMRLQCHQFF